MDFTQSERGAIATETKSDIQHYKVVQMEAEMQAEYLRRKNALQAQTPKAFSESTAKIFYAGQGGQTPIRRAPFTPRH